MRRVQRGGLPAGAFSAPSLRAPYLEKGTRAAIMGAPTSPVEVRPTKVSRLCERPRIDELVH